MNVGKQGHSVVLGVVLYVVQTIHHCLCLEDSISVEVLSIVKIKINICVPQISLYHIVQNCF